MNPQFSAEHLCSDDINFLTMSDMAMQRLGLGDVAANVMRDCLHPQFSAEHLCSDDINTS